MKLAVIGAGQMGQSLVKAFTKEYLDPADVMIFDADSGKSSLLAQETGCVCLEGTELNRLAVCDAVLLAVKPQIIAQVTVDLLARISEKAMVISIAAGISIEILRLNGLSGHPIVRVMPNTPALVGSAVSGIAFSDEVSASQREWTLGLFNACGLAVEVPEKLMDAVTGLSGSGPAYMMLIMEALADGGVRQGLGREQAMRMAAMTMLGSAKLVLETGAHPGQLKDQVCSPAGTTIEAVAVLEKCGIRSALIEAVAASSARARELGRH